VSNSNKEKEMKHIEGDNREQIVLYEETLDNIINESSAVRFIDAYVERLDLREIKFRVRENEMGRSSYTDRLLLKIYVYGYFNKIRSGRKLEAECKRNIELIWLTGRLAPDFKTITNFRKDNKEGIKRVFKEFLKLCNKLGLLSMELVGIDGTKIRAQNGNNNVYMRKNIDEVINRINKKIEMYLEEMDKNDIAEKGEFEILTNNIEKRLKKMKTRKEKAEAIKKIFEENPEIEKYYANDQESIFMKDKGSISPGYNLQAAVDDKNKLIVAIDVTRENNDQKQIVNMSDKVEEIKKEIGIEKEIKTIKVADAGYYSEQQITDAIDAGHDIYLAHPVDAKMKKDSYKEDPEKVPSSDYQLSRFQYNKEGDVYICPEKKLLKKIGGPKKDERGKETVYYKCKECKECLKRDNCTKDKSGRKLQVYVRKQEIDEFDKKIRSEYGKKIISKRKEICEHPFGTIKRNFGFTYFSMKGEDSALSESSFISFIYNLKRVINIVGIQKLMAMI
jgi:transposase